jgi:hypothetical protein
MAKNAKIAICRTVILPVLYRCETWSLTLMEELRLRVFESRVLRRIFSLKRDEVTGGWRKQQNEEDLHDLYSSPSIILMISQEVMDRSCSTNVGRGIHVGYWWESQKERGH